MARETVCCAPLNDDETRLHIVFLYEVYRKALWDRLNTSSGFNLAIPLYEDRPGLLLGLW